MPQNNPRMVFDMPRSFSKDYYIPADQFGRSDWPVSPEAQRYITSPEIISYREEVYSDQQSSSSSKPRDTSHYRLRGYRYGQMLR
ncbi:MAG: hypothetical protein JW860_10350 [Sedimentisphaerales bacterium]|nr:hypothetical protein [Sedimentisphaerales bacterium]